MEQAEHAFLRHLDWSVVREVEGAKISWPRVATQCVYHRPVVFESLFGIQVELTRVGRSSCTYRFRFLAPEPLARLELPAAAARETEWSTSSDWFSETGVQPFAEGTITAVCCRIVPGMSHQSIEIPAELRCRLEPYLMQSTFQE